MEHHQENPDLSDLSITEAEKILLISRYDFVNIDKTEFQQKLEEMTNAKPEFKEVYQKAYDVLENERIYNQKLSSYKKIQQIKNWIAAQIANLKIELISPNQHETLLFQKSMSFEKALKISTLEIDFLENRDWQDQEKI